MKPQFQHEITTSFTLWLDNYLLKRGEAFQNKTSDLTYLEDSRLGPGLNGFSSPYKQWVYDESITSAQIPDSATIDGASVSRNDGSGADPQLIIDHQNGRVITTAPTSSSISIDYAVKDFNTYVTNETEENLIIESKFDVNSRFKVEEIPIPPYAHAIPAIFINNTRNFNDPFSFGGQDQTMTDIRCVIMAENIFQLDGVLSIFNDSNKECFAALGFEDYPVTEFGDAPNFNYKTLANARTASNPAALHFIDRVDVSKLSDRITKKIDPNTFIGFIDFEVVTYRYPRI
jgi:hypothetical protein